jgi:hypothetical protein
VPSPYSTGLDLLIFLWNVVPTSVRAGFTLHDQGASQFRAPACEDIRSDLLKFLRPMSVVVLGGDAAAAPNASC